MSFQAYLDAVEVKTGKTPKQLIVIAEKKGFDKPDTKAGVIIDWLKEEYDLGRGHAMAMVHVIKKELLSAISMSVVRVVTVMLRIN